MEVIYMVLIEENEWGGAVLELDLQLNSFNLYAMQALHQLIHRPQKSFPLGCLSLSCKEAEPRTLHKSFSIANGALFKSRRVLPPNQWCRGRWCHWGSASRDKGRSMWNWSQINMWTLLRVLKTRVPIPISLGVALAAPIEKPTAVLNCNVSGAPLADRTPVANCCKTPPGAIPEYFGTHFVLYLACSSRNSS